jgi:hypothetical protein
MIGSPRLVPVALAALCAGGSAVACPPAPPYTSPGERPHYRLDLSVRPGLRLVEGSLYISFAPERSTDRLVFRLWPNGPRLAQRGAQLTVGAVVSEGRPLYVRRPNPTTLVVFPGHTLQAGELIRVSMSWRLRVPRAPGERLTRGRNFLRLGSFFPLLAWDARRGWVVDPPSTGPAEAWTSPTADFDVRLTAPRGLSTIGSGQKIGRGHWRGQALRDFALALGRFRYAGAVAHAPRPVVIRVGVLAGTGGPSPASFAGRAVRALEAHARRFGSYPWRTFSLVVFPGLGRGGIEYPTVVFQGRDSLFRATCHELGHQWFYSLVGNDQARDPWLDETLATWAAGRSDGILPLFAHWPIPASVRGHLGAPMTFWDRHENGFFAGAYAQGVRALASLGEPARVDCALRLYVAQNAYRTAAPRDLLAALRRFFPGAERKLRAYGARF